MGLTKILSGFTPLATSRSGSDFLANSRSGSDLSGWIRIRIRTPSWREIGDFNGIIDHGFDYNCIRIHPMGYIRIRNPGWRETGWLAGREWFRRGRMRLHSRLYILWIPGVLREAAKKSSFSSGPATTRAGKGLATKKITFFYTFFSILFPI